MDKKSVHIIAYHGWGFDASFWNPLQDCFNSNTRFDAAERGYFSKKKEPSFDSDRTINVVLTHSFGLHWCPDEILNQADHLMILGGFLNFHPSKEEENKRSKLLLRQMLTQFVDSPETVLEQFYKNSFHPSPSVLESPKNLKHDLLLSDLSCIQQDSQPQQRIFDVNTVTILHGSDDLIVPRKAARDMFHSLRYRSQYFEIMKAGHAFPVTHIEKCAEIINTVMFKNV
ncbi:MAG: alpha/beta hydrolase [Balneolaceae bacterium]